jgi:hypothetical protein
MPLQDKQEEPFGQRRCADISIRDRTRRVCGDGSRCGAVVVGAELTDRNCYISEGCPEPGRMVQANLRFTF